MIMRTDISDLDFDVEESQAKSGYRSRRMKVQQLAQERLPFNKDENNMLDNPEKEE